MSAEALTVSAPVLEARPQEEVTLTPDMMFNSAPQDPAAEAVTANYEAQMGIRERISNLGHNVSEIVARNKRKLVTAGIGAIAAFGATEPASANTQVVYGQPEVTTTMKYSIQGNTILDSNIDKVTVGVYNDAKGLSRAEQKKIVKEGGKCYKRKVGTIFTNSLVGANGKKFFYKDTVKAGKNKFCKTKNGKEYKVDCENDSYGPKPPTRIQRKLVEGKVIALRSWAKGNVKVEANSEAKVEARCETSPGNYALATGKAHGNAEARLNWRTVVSAKGRNISTKVHGDAAAKAVSESYASAVVVCSEMGGTIVDKPACPPEAPGEYPNCVPPTPGKDGTKTPQPPASAPGPNPAPSPEEPYPGGYQCYDEVTGAPKPANPDTTCPVGTVGAAV